MNLICGATEEIGLAIVAIAKRVIVVEYKIQTVKKIDNYGRVRHDEKARGRRATIDVLPPDIQRGSQHAACLPTNRLFVPAAGIPDDTFAFAVQNVEHFLEKIALRFGLRARRELAKITNVHSFAADQINVGAIYSGSQSRPRPNFGLTQIGDV